MKDQVPADAFVAINIFAKYEWLHPANTMHENAFRDRLNVELAKAAHDLESAIKQIILTYLHKEVR